MTAEFDGKDRLLVGDYVLAKEAHWHPRGFYLGSDRPRDGEWDHADVRAAIEEKGPPAGGLAIVTSI